MWALWRINCLFAISPRSDLVLICCHLFRLVHTTQKCNVPHCHARWWTSEVTSLEHLRFNLRKNTFHLMHCGPGFSEIIIIFICRLTMIMSLNGNCIWNSNMRALTLFNTTAKESNNKVWCRSAMCLDMFKNREPQLLCLSCKRVKYYLF